MKTLAALLAATTLVGCANFDEALAVFCDGGRCTPGNDSGRPDAGSPGDAGTRDGGAADAGPCFNRMRDPAESDIDCGGTCIAKCSAGLRCTSGADCSDGICHATLNVCTASTCNDGLLSTGETGIDCGGSCTTPCGLGGTCNAGADCDSGICHLTQRTCSASRCADGTQNDAETDVDCGGSCGGCGLDAGCQVPADCSTGACHATLLRCVSSSCFDARQNGAETGIDCGGSTCAARCDLGVGCTISSDCKSALCHATRLTCAETTCDDGLKNGTETDIDCGGGISCPKCAVGKQCTINSDCDPPSCDPSGRCRLMPFPEWGYARSTLCTREDATAAVLDGSIYVGGRNGTCDPSVSDAPTTVESGGWLPNDLQWVDRVSVLVGGRAGTSFIALPSGLLLRIGGSSDSLSSVTESVSFTDGLRAFQVVPSMSSRRAYFASTVLPNGQVFVAGGHSTDFAALVPSLSSTEYFTPIGLSDGGLTGSWAAGPTLGINRSGSRAVVVGSDIWVMGGVEVLGSRGPELANIERVPLSGGAPQSGAPMPTGRAFFGATMGPDGRLYVAGGRERDAGTATVTAYDPASQRWYEVSPLPEARSHGALVVGRDNRLYYINGRSPTGTPQGTVFTYGGSVSIDPVSGQRDAGIRVIGLGFPPAVRVDVRLGQPNGPLLATFSTNINGDFPNQATAYFNVPRVDAGTYEIYVTDVNTRYPLKVPLTVVP